MSHESQMSLLQTLRPMLQDTSIAGLVGGPEELEDALRQVVAGALPVLGELAKGRVAEVPLAEAVFDPERFPHLSRAHGFVKDLLVMDLSRDLLSVAEEILTTSDHPETRALRRRTAWAAVGSAPAAAHLARFALFEALCLNQRLLLLAEGRSLEAIGGRSSDVETIAEREVELAIDWSEYAQSLVKAEDPLRALVAAAAVNLAEHASELRDRLPTLKASVHEALLRRERIMEVMQALEPTDAVIVANECAEVLGEERLEVDCLRRLHPMILGHLSRDAVYQRVHRLPVKIEHLGSPSRQHRGVSLADMILGSG